MARAAARLFNVNADTDVLLPVSETTTADTDLSYGIGKGWIGGYTYLGHHDGETVSGTGYYEYVRVAPSRSSPRWSHARAADGLETSPRRKAARGAHRRHYRQPPAPVPVPTDVQCTRRGPGRGGPVRATHDREFLAIVAAVVGEQNAQRYAAILLTGAHGAAGLESSGLLHADKWQTTADELTDALIAMVAEADRHT